MSSTVTELTNKCFDTNISSKHSNVWTFYKAKVVFINSFAHFFMPEVELRTNWEKVHEVHCHCICWRVGHLAKKFKS